MKTETGTVTVEISDSVKPSKTYTKTVYESAQDILAVLQQGAEKAKEVLAALNYGWDLKARAAVRAQILRENEGPEVALEKMVKDIIKRRLSLGKPISEEKARAMAKAFLESES